MHETAETCRHMHGMSQETEESQAAVRHRRRGRDMSITKEAVTLMLRKVKDPDMQLNIIDIGLVYDIVITDDDVRVDMTLTSPSCPSGNDIMTDAHEQLSNIPGIGTVTMHLVWTPPWHPDKIDARVRAYLGF